MFQFKKFIVLLPAVLLIACAQKERAGDITLATPAPAQATLFQSSGNNRSTATSSAENIIAGTNLTSYYGGAVSAGASSSNPEGGLRMPSGISAPSGSASGSSSASPNAAAVALPVPVQSPDSVSPVAATADPASNNAGQPTSASGTSNASSSSLIEGSKIPARSITIVRTKPDCSSADCPSIKVKRLSFIGRDRFNNFLDQTMASMAEVDASNNAAFRTLAEFATYFWKISKPGYQVVLEASVRRGDEDLVVVQLDSYIFTGGAHGLSTTQYINWLPQTDKILSLESMLLPKKMPAFEQALKKQHAIWLKSNPQAIENPAAYNKLWPFVPTDNAALLSDGLAVTYDPYSIAPYSFGRPTITIPYSELVGILRPELLP